MAPGVKIEVSTDYNSKSICCGVTMNCNCASSGLGFSKWTPFKVAAGAENNRFSIIPQKPGVYCLRALRIGEYDQATTIARYLESPLFDALKAMGVASEKLFHDFELGDGWGWEWYAEDAKRIESMKTIKVGTDGILSCPILYIGCSTSLWHRISGLMEIRHVANHALWAILHSACPIELSFLVLTDA